MERQEILVTKKEKDGKTRYLWAWKESADKKVFGVAATVDEIKKSARNMFPNKEIVLKIL